VISFLVHIKWILTYAIIFLYNLHIKSWLDLTSVMPLKKRPHISYGDACVEKLGVVGIDLFMHHQEEIHILYEGETLKESWMFMTNLF
jgi:hypothetical protein